MIDYTAILSQGLSYDDFLTRHGSDEHRRRWADLHAKVRLSPAQTALLKSFTREMPVVCLAGAWCGDCVNQCPIFEHFARTTDKIRLRYFDRDTHPELGAELQMCGGARVPVVVFLTEDGLEVSRFGDRTLSKYRQLVRDAAGASCPTGITAPADDVLATVVQEWLEQFERAQWMLRTSSRLRQKHGD